jgi:N utilization substance protein B
VVRALAASRRQARERALSLLYEAETKGVTPAEVLAELPLEPAPFAADLVLGVGVHQDEVDGWIVRFARDWALDRMPAVDRALLRLGVYELVHRPDVPTGAVISEAVELAQRYSTDDSSRFVNGVLAAIAAQVRPSASAPAGEVQVEAAPDLDVDVDDLGDFDAEARFDAESGEGAG